MLTFVAVSRSTARLRIMPAPALRWAAVFCALTVWVLGLLAISPQLHATLHGDSDQQGHTCAITLFNHSVDDGTAQTLVVIGPLVRLEDAVVQPMDPTVLAPRYRLLPGHAPPVR